MLYMYVYVMYACARDERKNLEDRGTSLVVRNPPCYWWTYLQGRNGDAAQRTDLRDTVGAGVGRRGWDRWRRNSMETYTNICKMDSQQGFAGWLGELEDHSRWSSWPRDQTQVSRIAGRHFIIWATTSCSAVPPPGTHWMLSQSGRNVPG